MDPVPTGVKSLDHTADLGLELIAPTLPELFTRAALGTAWLIRGGDRGTEWAGPEDGDVPGGAAGEGGTRGPAGAVRSLRLSAPDLPALLRAWLRELVFWHETEGLSFRAARFGLLGRGRLEAEVTLFPDPTPDVREIKGVTLHGLMVEPHGDEWTGRVIFDV